MFGHHGFVIQNREENKEENDKKDNEEENEENEEEEENVMRFVCVRILKGHRSGTK